MKEVTIESTRIELKKGDITRQDDIQAVVNAANAELRTGGGVAGAIHRAAGSELAQGTSSMAPINPGEAVISQAYNLPNDYVIHCLGPVYGRDKPEEELLANCYRNALNLTDKNEIESIAFPAISTGAFGYPVKGAATVAFMAIKAIADRLKTVKLIRFVIWGDEKLRIHEEVMDEVFG
ncbi:MAG TPA: macro domain-containing protein [Balneolaceae bacterium]